MAKELFAGGMTSEAIAGSPWFQVWLRGTPLTERVSLLAGELQRAGLPPEFVGEVEKAGVGLLQRSTGRWPAAVKAAVAGLSPAQRTIFNQQHQLARYFESGVPASFLKKVAKKAVEAIGVSKLVPQRVKGILEGYTKAGMSAESLVPLTTGATGGGVAGGEGMLASIGRQVADPTKPAGMLKRAGGAFKGVAKWLGPVGGGLLGYQVLSETAGANVRARKVLDAYHKGEGGVNVSRAYLEDWLAKRTAVSQRRAMVQRDPQMMNAVVQAVTGGRQASAGGSRPMASSTWIGGGEPGQDGGQGPTPADLDQRLDSLLSALA